MLCVTMASAPPQQPARTQVVVTHRASWVATRNNTVDRQVAREMFKAPAFRRTQTTACKELAPTEHILVLRKQCGAIIGTKRPFKQASIDLSDRPLAQACADEDIGIGNDQHPIWYQNATPRTAAAVTAARAST